MDESIRMNSGAPVRRESAGLRKERQVRRLFPACFALFLFVSGSVVAQRVESDERRRAAQTSLWRSIRDDLKRSKDYWGAIRDAVIPGGFRGLDALRGTVVSSSPPAKPTEIVLAMSDDQTPEVTLQLVDRRGTPTGFKKAITSGTTVEFSGIARKFSAEPFMLTFQVELGVDKEPGLWILGSDKPNNKGQAK